MILSTQLTQHTHDTNSCTNTMCISPQYGNNNFQTTHVFFLPLIYTSKRQKVVIALDKVQSNLSCVTLQGNSEIWSHKTGGRLIQVFLKYEMQVKEKKN